MAHIVGTSTVILGIAGRLILTRITGSWSRRWPCPAAGAGASGRALVNDIVLESRRCLAVLDETCGSGRAVEVVGGSAAAQSHDSARRRFHPGNSPNAKVAH